MKLSCTNPSFQQMRDKVFAWLRVVLVCVAIPYSLHAQKRWDGGGGNNRWSTSNNWNSNGVPGSGDTVLFDNTYVGTLPSTIELRGNRTINILSFNTDDTFALVNGTGSRTLTLNSGQITRSAGSAGVQSLDFSYLNLAANGAFNIAGTGSLNISAIIRDSGGARSITKTGSGNLILSGANTFTGATNINAGKLQISSDSNLGGTSGALTINGGTLATTSTMTLNTSLSPPSRHASTCA